MGQPRPDAMVAYWDELHAAVLARLLRIAERGTSSSWRDDLRDCIQALAQLQACRGAAQGRDDVRVEQRAAP